MYVCLFKPIKMLVKGQSSIVFLDDGVGGLVRDPLYSPLDHPLAITVGNQSDMTSSSIFQSVNIGMNTSMVSPPIILYNMKSILLNSI